MKDGVCLHLAEDVPYGVILEAVCILVDVVCVDLVAAVCRLKPVEIVVVVGKTRCVRFSKSGFYVDDRIVAVAEW